jgi:hypothetical protein
LWKVFLAWLAVADYVSAMLEVFPVPVSERSIGLFSGSFGRKRWPWFLWKFRRQRNYAWDTGVISGDPFFPAESESHINCVDKSCLHRQE